MKDRDRHTEFFCGPVKPKLTVWVARREFDYGNIAIASTEEKAKVMAFDWVQSNHHSYSNFPSIVIEEVEVQ